MKIPFPIIQLARGLKVIFGVSKFHHQIEVNDFCESTLYPLDLTDKLNFDYIEVDNVPQVRLTDGSRINFPIHQAQIGLALWDRYIKFEEIAALKQFENITKALVDQIDGDGKIDTWSRIRPGGCAYSAMTQSLAASVIMRYELIVLETDPVITEKLLNSLVEDRAFTSPRYGALEEIPHSSNPCVFNGWLYSLFVFFEYQRMCRSERYSQFLEAQLQLLEGVWPRYLCAFGSYYDLGLNFASPFYHDLHVKQVTVLNELTNHRFRKLAKELLARNKMHCKFIMTILRGLQKLREREFNEIQG